MFGINQRLRSCLVAKLRAHMFVSTIVVGTRCSCGGQQYIVLFMYLREAMLFLFGHLDGSQCSLNKNGQTPFESVLTLKQ